MDLLQQAHALAQSGDLEGSANACRAILARDPRHGYALFLLGSIEAQLGRIDEAAKHLRGAVAANPGSPDALMALARVLLEQKRAKEAADMLSRALAVAPHHPLALILRGQAFAQMERAQEALADFTRALQLDPRALLALENRAHLLAGLKRTREARADFDAILELAHNHLPALMGRIALLTEEKDFTGALADCVRGLKLAPGNAELWNARGFALMQMQRRDEAIAAFEEAIQRDPKSSSAYLHIANMLMEAERLEDALAFCEKALAVVPAHAPLLVLKGNILLHLGRVGASLASHAAAIAAAPDYAEAHYHRGSALLLSGTFDDGFAEFEYRWQVQDCGFDRPKLQAPEWRGEALTGKSIIVYSEQGLGDTIQFARFLPRLVEMGAKLTFLCHPALLRLFRPFAATMEAVAEADAGRRFDFQCALMSLPLRLGLDARAIPSAVPYLHAESDRVARWRERIGARGLKIGIGWQGNPKGAIDRGRSIPLSAFAPLSAIPGVRLISLQKTHGLDQLARLPAGMAMETLGDFDMGADAFIDTAAILESLDLVVTSDTALPHLAGALAIPTFIALKAVPDWRWMLDREDSPWYPSLTLFRQTARGDWDGVFARIAGAVRRLTQEKGSP